MNRPEVIAIVGPTASGKTDLAFRVAKMLNGELISADSRQIYQGMDIGTAKEKSDSSIDQWGIDLVEPDESYSAARFRQYGREKIFDIRSRGKLSIVVGGTGFWVRALLDDFVIPSVPPDSELREILDKKTVDELFKQYESLDNVGALKIDKNNKRRLIRATEVCLKTGEPFSKWIAPSKPYFSTLYIGISQSREGLRTRIDARVDKMMNVGFLDEVSRLKDKYGCDISSMSGIGYRELCEYLNSEITLDLAVKKIKTNTFQYAKRQLTWFNRDERVHWVRSQDEAIEIIRKSII